MKQIFIFFTACSFLLLSATSCTDKDNDDIIQRVEPGVYYIEKNLGTVTSQATTKGVTADYEFDKNYDYDVIYLHKIGGAADDCIEIPVTSSPTGNTQTPYTYSIRYRVEVDDNIATITPLQGPETPYGQKTLTLDASDNTAEVCYFSSWPTAEWAMEEDQWSIQQWAGQSTSYYLYYRKNNINKEIYRSGASGSEKDLSIKDLTDNTTLNLTQGCAAFMLSTILYDSSKSYSGGTQYIMDEEIFKGIMGQNDAPEKWYIKIYVGGECFPQTYNIETCSPGSGQTPSNGYYSSGDAATFGQGEIVGQYFLAFREQTYNQTVTSYGGYGYLSQVDNVLFAPVVGGVGVKAYVLIKHWTGTGTPGTPWLLSDVGALQTEISPSSNNEPAMADFIKVALIMDLTQFKKAWNGVDGDGNIIEGAGDEAQNELIRNVARIDPETGEYIDGSNQLSTRAVYDTTITRSPSGAPVRTFTLPKDAIVIQEVY